MSNTNTSNSKDPKYNLKVDDELNDILDEELKKLYKNNSLKEKTPKKIKAKKENKIVNNKNENDHIKEIKPSTQKKVMPNAGGIKNIKEMIEQNLKRQRVMSPLYYHFHFYYLQFYFLFWL